MVTLTPNMKSRIDAAKEVVKSAPPRDTPTQAPPRPQRRMVYPPPKYPVQWLYAWGMSAIVSPYRLKRLLSWAWDVPWRSWEFLRVVTGGRLDRAAYDARMAHCEDCSRTVFALKVVGKELTVKSYCGGCKCPRWYPARLDVKNWFKNWKCPNRFHDGPYDETVWMDTAKTLSRSETVPTGEPVRQGGCGGG